MIPRNRIWEELKQAKANIICLQKYTDKKRKHNRWYNTFIAITASIGTFGYIIDSIIPAITSGLIGLGAIAKSILPGCLQNEQELSSLDSLIDFYVRYMNSLERIWYNLENKKITEDEAMEMFFDLKETESDKLSQLNKGIRNISKSFQELINQEASKYINAVYFQK